MSRTTKVLFLSLLLAVSLPTPVMAADQSVDLDPAELADLLPEALPGGFARASLESGVMQGAPGAMGEYERDRGGNGTEQLDIVIYDIVAMDNPRDYSVRERVRFQMEADSASETEETTLAGHPAFMEPLDEVTQEMLVLVGERLVIEASSMSLSNERLREVLSALDWDRIAGLLDSD